MPSLGAKVEVEETFSYSYSHTLEYDSIISSWTVEPVSVGDGITVSSNKTTFSPNTTPTPTPITITVEGQYPIACLTGGVVNHVQRGVGGEVVEGTSFFGLDPVERQVVEFRYPTDTEITITVNFDQTNGSCAPLVLTHTTFAKRSSYDSTFEQFL